MAAPSIQWYDATDTTLQTAAINGTLAAGSTIAAVTYHVFNDRLGTLGSTTVKNARIVAEGWDGTNYVRSGLPWLDEGWLQIALVGQDNTGDATMVAQTTAFTPLGTNRFLPINDIPKNCARYVSAKIVGPSGLSTLSADMRMIVVYDETSAPLSQLASLSSSGGIIPDRLTATARKVVASTTITASGVASVVVSERLYVYDGTVNLAPPQTVTLNQTSGSGALAVGQSYIAVLSQANASAVVTVTKGNAAASPVAPATPTNEIFIGKVTVVYQAGGTSIINQGNVDQTSLVLGEYALTAGAGLNLTIGSGSAISTADVKMFSTASTSLALADNTVSYIFVNSDGTFSTATLATGGAAGAVLLGSVQTAAGAITTISTLGNSTPQRVDRAIDRYVMVLKYRGPLSVLTQADWDLLPFAAVLDEVMTRSGSGGGGAAKIDVKTAADVDLSSGTTTIYTSSGTWDQRPFVVSAANSFVKHERRTFAKGVAFVFDVVSVDATPPTDVTVQLHFRRT